ncbi:MAG: hypothetical protein ABIO24_05520, partial [Saprospiraceae bacterium]
MRARLLFITLLFPFCCALLPAQSQQITVINQETTLENPALAPEINQLWKLDHFARNYSPYRSPCQVFIGVGTSP